MESTFWKLLLVEDDEDDMLLVRDMLNEVRRGQFSLDWRKTYEDALDRCKQESYQACLIDYRLGMRDGLELVREMTANGCTAPVILLTGQGSYDIDLEAMKAGATDYLVKGEINASLLERAIRYAIERKHAEESLRKAHDELELRVQERTRDLMKANQELHAEMNERIQAQEALTRSEARFRQLAESTSTAIFIVEDFRIRYANPAAKMITGYSPAELVGRKFWEIAHPVYQPVLKRYGLTNSWDRQMPSRYELKIVTREGEERWLDLSSGEMEYEGSPALVVTAFDITERDLAEKALKKAKDELEVRVAARTEDLRRANFFLAEANQQLAYANQRLQTVLSALPVAVWIASADGAIIDKNVMADQVSAPPAAGDPAQDGLPFDHGSWADTGQTLQPEDWPLARAITRGETSIGEAVDILRSDGSQSTILFSAAPILNSEEEIVGAVAVGQDITQIKQVEAEMRRDAARIEVQRRIIQYRELERLDIAQDLHDGPLQELIGLAYTLTGVLQMAYSDPAEIQALQEGLQDVQERLKHQIRELRLFCSELRPPTLMPFGLEKAIRSHAETFLSRYPQVLIKLDLAPDGHRLPEKVRLALYRIYQEAMSNVVKHSEATQVEVRLHLDESQVILSVSDNGVGFDTPENWLELARHGHLGLVGAQERTEAIGGCFSVVSHPKRGSSVQVTVPLDHVPPDRVGD